jgi:hypothetical protein
VRRAGRVGDGWYAPPFPTHGELRVLAEHFQDEPGHRSPGDRKVAIRREMFVRGGPSWHEDAFWAGVGERFAVFQRWGEATSLDDAAVAVGSPGWEDSQLIIGSAEECAAAIRWLRDHVAMTDLIIKVQWPGVPHPVSLAQLELLGSQVFPLIRKDQDD